MSARRYGGRKDVSDSRFTHLAVLAQVTKVAKSGIIPLTKAEKSESMIVAQLNNLIMKIEHLDGTVTDTERVTNDVHAAVLEKSQELFGLCKQFKVPFFLRWTLGGDLYTGGFNFDDGNQDPRLVRFDLMNSILRRFEAEYPGMKLVMMPQDTYDKLRGNKSE